MNNFYTLEPISIILAKYMLKLLASSTHVKIFNLTLAMLLGHYTWEKINHKNERFRSLPLKSVSGSKKPVRSRRKSAEVYSKCSKLWPLAFTRACSRVCHWSTTLSITLRGTDDVMAIRLLRHCEISHGKVSSQEVQKENNYNFDF